MANENTMDKEASRSMPSDEDKPGERFFPHVEGDVTAQRPSGAKATVAIARTVERYRDDKTIYTLTREAIDLIGGIERFVRPGQSVLIKPNQTGYFLADEGMTTDPRLVAALIRLSKEAGARQVTVG